jgi:hypothetical protein
MFFLQIVQDGMIGCPRKIDGRIDGRDMSGSATGLKAAAQRRGAETAAQGLLHAARPREGGDQFILPLENELRRVIVDI